MKALKILALSSFVCASAMANVTAYFNQNSGSRYTDPYRNISRAGDNLEQVLINEIKSARKSISLAVMELRLPLVAKALVQAKEKGVDVRVIIEHDYNFTVTSQRNSQDGEYEASKLTELKAFVDTNKDGKISKEELEDRDAIYILRAGKIPVMDDTYDNSSGSGLMHHKFLVVDGNSTIVSSANLTMSCVHGDTLTSSSRGNANSMMQIDSASFARIFTEEFNMMWGNGKRGNFGMNKTYRGPESVSVGGKKITVQFSPTSQRYNWEESTNGLMASFLSKATKSIKAALFVFSDQKLADVIYDRYKKRADVGIIIEPKFAYRDYSELLDVMGLEVPNKNCDVEPENNPWKSPLAEAGAARLPGGDVLHHKFAVIDGTTVVMGSQNWSDSANFINDETLIVVQDAAIADKYTREYNRIKQTASLGIPESLKRDIRAREANCQGMIH